MDGDGDARKAAGGGHVRAGSRLLVAAGVGVTVAAGLATVAPWQVSVLVGWDIACAVMLGWVATQIIGADGDLTAALASREDPSRAAADLVVLGASVVSLFAVASTLIKAGGTSGGSEAALTGVAVGTVILSWAIVHTMYLLRYARVYYAEPVGGVEFNEPGNPDYLDFAYLAFTVGMTYQVSDTNLTSRDIRRTVLGHALLSFVFGTAVIAVTVNLVVGLVNG